jgi:site-specific recombinase XerD
MPSVIIKRHARAAGLRKRVSTHTLRRAAAARMLSAGEHPALVAETLGLGGLKVLDRLTRAARAAGADAGKEREP